MNKMLDYEIAHQECKAYRKRWGNKNIFEYGEKMLEIEDKEDDIMHGELKTPEEMVTKICNEHKKYKYENLEDLPGTIVMLDENDDLIELKDNKDIEKHIDYLTDMKDNDYYVRVRSHDGVITEIYKTLDGKNYDWYLITEEDFE